MPYYRPPNDFKRVRIISPMVVIASVTQFFVLFFYRYISGIDETSGYVTGFFYPIIFVSSVGLILTAINGIRSKNIGLLDLVIVAIVLIASYVIFNS